jgi:hypothetical protein
MRGNARFFVVYPVAAMLIATLCILVLSCVSPTHQAQHGTSDDAKANAGQQPSHAPVLPSEQVATIKHDDKSTTCADQCKGKNQSMTPIYYWILLFITGCQAVFMWNTARIMRDTARRQLRAYILVTGTTIKTGSDGNSKIEIIVENLGQTPASDTSFQISGNYVSYPANVEDFVPNNPTMKSGGPLAPRVPLRLIAEGDMFINSSTVASCKKAVCVFGTIRYKDMFKKDHTTDFRLICVGEAIRERTFAQDRDGNKVT